MNPNQPTRAASARPNWLAVSAALGWLCLVSCTSQTVSGSSATSEASVGFPFDRCSTESGPEPAGDGALTLDQSSISPGDSLIFTWTFVEGQESVMVGNEMLVTCWTGDSWRAVWGAFDVFGDAEAVLVSEDVALEFTDDGWTERVGRVPVPLEAPPGAYRIEGSGDEVRFEVVAG